MPDPRKERVTGSPPRPDILWQLGKTVASIRFIQEATLYLSVCSQDSRERQMLVSGMDAVKSGGRVLKHYLPVEIFVEAGLPLFWQVETTDSSKRFVREAERYVADGHADATASQMLGAAIEAIKDGERVLTHPVEVDDFLVSGFPLPWEIGLTPESKRFVREAVSYVAEGRADAEAAQMLDEAVSAVKGRERTLTAHLEIGDFLTSGFPL